MGATQSLMEERIREKDLILPSEIANLRYVSEPLCLRSAKVMHFLICCSAIDISRKGEHLISLKNLNRQFHIGRSEWCDLFSQLVRCEVNMSVIGQYDPKKTGSLFNYINIVSNNFSPTNGVLVSWEFSDLFHEMIETSEIWATIPKDKFLSLKSRYSMRLCELIALRKNLLYKKTHFFSFDSMREHFGVVPGRLVLWSEFRKRALDPAIKEANRLFDLSIEYGIVKDGRGTYGIELRWKSRTSKIANA